MKITLNTELFIQSIDEFNKLKDIYSRKQPIKFICPICNKEEHLLFNVLYKRNNLLCHNCLLQANAECFSQKEPLNYFDIQNISKRISPVQQIKFICLQCNKEHIVQYRHYTCNICEHCKRSNSAKIASNNIETREKTKKTMLERYGVESISKNREYMNAAWERKYGKGITASMHLQSSKEKQKQTMLERYGGYTLQSKELRSKVDNTVKQIYGTTNIRNSKYYLEKYEHFKDDLYKNLKRLYQYDNQYFDSSWEVAYYIWLKDNNIDFIYHPKPGIKYISENKEHTYYPDFIINGKYIEIKGDQFFNKDGTIIIKSQFDIDKWNCILSNAQIYRKKDILKQLQYVNKKYGKNYIKQFKQF